MDDQRGIAEEGYVKGINKYFASTEINKQINGWADYFSRLKMEGRKLYFLTFMFKPLKEVDRWNKEINVDRWNKEIMKKVVYEVYGRLITRVVRYPRKFAGDLVLVGAPDRPVPHRRKRSSKDVKINNGLHMHAIVALARRTQLKVGLKQHIKDDGAYLLENLPLRRIHVKRCKRSPRKVTRYLLKGISRRSFDLEDMVICPKASSEF